MMRVARESACLRACGPQTSLGMFRLHGLRVLAHQVSIEADIEHKTFESQRPLPKGYDFIMEPYMAAMTVHKR